MWLPRRRRQRVRDLPGGTERPGRDSRVEHQGGKGLAMHDDVCAGDEQVSRLLRRDRGDRPQVAADVAGDVQPRGEGEALDRGPQRLLPSRSGDDVGRADAHVAQLRHEAGEHGAVAQRECRRGFAVVVGGRGKQHGGGHLGHGIHCTAARAQRTRALGCFDGGDCLSLTSRGDAAWSRMRACLPGVT